MGNTPDTSKKKKTFIAPVAACAALFLLLLAGFIAFLVFTRRKKQKQIAKDMQVEAQTTTEEPGYSKRKGGLARFTYSEVKIMTSGLERELGKGGFGVVYYGCLKDGTEVAVKMLSPSIHASEQFSTEVELLMGIHHKNLVSLVGYCEEGTNLALIYEYMASGNLQTLLSDSRSLSWKERLHIAIDAAQGLDYLHSGCRPPIVHRDVKTPNILLNKALQARIADFGLSKIFPDEHRSYVSTRVIGTPGYLDPEYHVTQQLNEKSDVYSYGVVLLELITGQAGIVKINKERTSLVQWVTPMLERGDIWNIVDQRLQQEMHNPNSVWRVMEIAMSCVKPTATQRPTMSQIVTDLKECLAMEMDAGNSRGGTDDSVDMSPVVSFTAMGPAAR